MSTLLRDNPMTTSAPRERTYTFTLLLQGADPLEHLDALFEAGCDDAVFGERDGVSFAEFDRVAVNFPEAVGSAIGQIESSVPGLRVIRVEPEELVNASAIAGRTKRTRESIRLLIDHKRGPGNFPPPVVWVAAKHRLWRWSEVARWFAESLGERTDETVSGAFLSTCNAALEVRNYAPKLDPDEGRDIVQKIVHETPGLF